MVRVITATVIFGLWFFSMSWLVRYEVYPHYFTGRLRGYKDIMPSELVLLDQWYEVYFRDRLIGFANSSTDIDETSPFYYYIINNQLRINIEYLNNVIPVDFNSVVYLDMINNLQKFSVTLTARSIINVKINVLRRDRNAFNMMATFGDRVIRSYINIPDDSIIFIPQGWLFYKKVLSNPAGVIVLMKDPFTMKDKILKFRLKGKDTLVLSKQKLEVYIIEAQLENFLSRIWIDREGKTLKQEFPAGFMLVSSDADKVNKAHYQTLTLDFLEFAAFTNFTARKVSP